MTRRALISVFDKKQVRGFAQGLQELGFEILSTGGTARQLTEQGVAVTAVSAVTGFPEILDGRVKTLHPAIHAGILSDRSKETHQAELDRQGMSPIDLVAVNLYPFRQTVASGADRDACIEMIDIGGPTMIRAAAKNHATVWVVVDPADYSQILNALREGDQHRSHALRTELATKAFQHTTAYDREIADWMAATDGSELPTELTLNLRRELVPRYGENPHQLAAVYRLADQELLGGYQQLQGKQLSYNNFLDLDAARSLAASFAQPCVAIVKHNNPCGVGLATDLEDAYQRALACDPVSAFGSVIGVNRPVDPSLAAALQSLFVEVIVAPTFTSDALALFGKKANLRLIQCPIEPATGVEYRSIDGGLLTQQRDSISDKAESWSVATERQPSQEELDAMRLAWTVCGAVRSNAIVLANAEQTVGIGAGQMSRVDSCRIAIDKATIDLQGTCAASDAFFPFADGLETLAQAGVTAVVQPGGSRRDDEVIATANRLGVAMMMTGRRHFRH